MIRKTAAAAVLLTGVFFFVADGQEKETARRVPEDLLKRIGVIGASVSAGFGTTLDLGSVLDTAVKSRHEMVDVSSSVAFINPRQWGEEGVKQLQAQEVTVAIGLDYFFWFSYGMLSPEKRLALLEKGFEFADRLECPMIVGDIPDMREAAGGMLAFEQVPSKEELRALNKRLREWAAERPRVHMISLAQLIEDLKGGKEIILNGKSVTFEKGELMQPDQLHATNKGLAVLAIKILEELAGKYPTIDRGGLILDYETLAGLVEQLPPQKEAEEAEDDIYDGPAEGQSK